MPIPKAITKKALADIAAGNMQHTKKPDLDNMVKFVKDCLNGEVWHDDSQVVNLSARKQYCGVTGTEITVKW